MLSFRDESLAHPIARDTYVNHDCKGYSFALHNLLSGHRPQASALLCNIKALKVIQLIST